VRKDEPVLVVGLGPAGASTAIFLAQLGLHVVAIDRKPKTALQIGESLPPDAKKVLQELGVWGEFEAADHEKCYGNQSYWNSDTAYYHDFLHHPVGYGWHIDRPGFEAMLRGKAERMGVEVDMQTRIDALEYDGRTWNVALARNAQTASNRFFSCIVDATGRNSWVARRQGVDRLYEDRQLALVAFLHSEAPLRDSTTLVETAEHGWWYSARIPGNRVATAFVCRPDTTQQGRWATEDGWWALIKQAKHTAARMGQCGGELLLPPKFVSADSGILETVYGNGWLAVGDAAMTYDPIASHGLIMSMVSARDAAAAVHAALNEAEGAFKQYGERMFSAFKGYSEMRATYYPAVG
jgi:flavin-dependent dehydrogenase